MSQPSLEDLKLQVVKAVRMLEKIQLLDMNGHVSCRIPGTDRFLINSRQASRASIAVQDVVMCDVSGTPVDNFLEPPSEVHIHAAIYKRRPDVGAVIHGHPHWQTVLGIADIPIRPVFGIGAFVTHVHVYEKASLINTPELGEEVAETLGNDRVVLLRNHGNVVVGDDVPTAFATSVYVEENAKKLFYASALGAKLKVLEGENLARTIETSWSPSIVQKVWKYYEEKSAKEGALQGILGEREGF